MNTALIIRSIREGTLQLWRNPFLSFTTIGLGALILFLLNIVFALEFYTQHMLKDLESRADFVVPLQENYEVFEFEALKNDLNNNYRVELETLAPELQEGFEVPKRLHIKFGNLHEVPEVFETLKGLRYQEVIGVWYSDIERDFIELVQRLIKFESAIEKTTQGLVLLFLVGGVILVINTFRLMLFSRKEEIFVARLVGADTKFIAGPFLWEGFLLGVGAFFAFSSSFCLGSQGD